MAWLHKLKICELWVIVCLCASTKPTNCCDLGNRVLALGHYWWHPLDVPFLFLEIKNVYLSQHCLWLYIKCAVSINTFPRCNPDYFGIEGSFRRLDKHSAMPSSIIFITIYISSICFMIDTWTNILMWWDLTPIFFFRLDIDWLFACIKNQFGQQTTNTSFFILSWNKAKHLDNLNNNIHTCVMFVEVNECFSVFLPVFAKPSQHTCIPVPLYLPSHGTGIIGSYLKS